jgi:hypothetical protein
MKTTHLISAATLTALGFACGGSKAPATSTTTTTNATINPSQPRSPSDPSQPPPTPADLNDAAGTGKTRTVPQRHKTTPSPGAEPVSPGAIR